MLCNVSVLISMYCFNTLNVIDQSLIHAPHSDALCDVTHCDHYRPEHAQWSRPAPGPDNKFPMM